MSEKLLDIRPTELKFSFELRRQSSCTFVLVNNSDHYVAFKVKTTSPEKYSVRPNIGFVQPKVSCDVTVVMEAQHVAPAYLKCKDKFLIQSTIVPFGTTGEQITHSLFSKDSGNYIDETKLRVVLVSAVANGVKSPSAPLMANEDLKLLKPEESKLTQDMVDGKAMDSEEEAKLNNDVKELKLQLRKTELKLNEVEANILHLREKRGIAANGTLKQATLKTDGSPKEIQVGFSFLFICLVALIALEFGYHLGP